MRLAAVVIIGFAAPLAAQTAQPHVPKDVIERIRETVANQVTADLALYTSGWPSPLEPRYVEVTPVKSVGRLSVLRARALSVFHQDPYSVLVVDTTVLPLGGSETERFVRSVDMMHGIAGESSDLAAIEMMVLASEARFGAPYFLDSSSAVRDGEMSPAVAAQWLRARPPQWPTAGTKALDDGRKVVRVTVLRPKVSNIRDAFTPVAYAFILGPDGALLAAAVREGVPF